MGNVTTQISDRKAGLQLNANGKSTLKANTLSYQQYYPFGWNMPGRTRQTQKSRFGVNGMEKENELSSGSLDFGARKYDSRLAKWWSVDPSAGNYPSSSPYVGIGNNPILYIDGDGRDIVYYDATGKEVHRVKSEVRHETFIQVENDVLDASPNFYQTKKYAQVPMPNRITEAIAGDNHDYNQHDHIIAVETYLFNQRKEDGTLQPISNLTPDPDGGEIRNLDPNVVKAVAIKETRAGKLEGGFRKGQTDIMQANVTGDWSWKKGQYLGLKKGKSTSNVQESVRAGVMILYWKGIEVTKTKDADGKTTGYESSWVGGDYWDEAVKRYNGGGDPKYMNKIITHYNALLEGKTDGVYKKEQEEKQAAADSTNTSTEKE